MSVPTVIIFWRVLGIVAGVVAIALGALAFRRSKLAASLMLVAGGLMILNQINIIFEIERKMMRSMFGTVTSGYVAAILSNGSYILLAIAAFVGRKTTTSQSGGFSPHMQGPPPQPGMMAPPPPPWQSPR